MERQLEHGRHPKLPHPDPNILEEIREMNLVILKEEEEATTEFPSILRLLIKKISIAGNKP